MRLKSLILEEKYTYGCIMGVLPSEIASSIIAFGRSIIPDSILYFDPAGKAEYGREREPHITIKFGLTQNYSQEQLKQILKGTVPFIITVQQLGIFSNSLFDVVKIDVQPDKELLRLRDVLNALPNADEHKEYHPHITLAYVKSGYGKQFQNRTGKGFSRIPINRLKYSSPNNSPIFFDL